MPASTILITAQNTLRTRPGLLRLGYTTGHPYSFEVFARDTNLDLDPAKAKRKAAIEAILAICWPSGVLCPLWRRQFQASAIAAAGNS